MAAQAEQRTVGCIGLYDRRGVDSWRLRVSIPAVRETEKRPVKGRSVKGLETGGCAK